MGSKKIKNLYTSTKLGMLSNDAEKESEGVEEVVLLHPSLAALFRRERNEKRPSEEGLFSLSKKSKPVFCKLKCSICE